MMVVTRLYYNYYNVYDIHFYSILFEIVKELGGGGARKMWTNVRE